MGTSTFLKIAFAVSLFVTGFNLKAFSQCNAGFTWAQTANNTIQCTNVSTGGYLTLNAYVYYWGDGSDPSWCSSGDTPHVYFNPGTYWVCMGMWYNGSMCDSFCTSVTVTGCAAVANFIVYPDTLIPHLYYAEDISSGVPITYYWNWGDGTFDTIQFPNHTYAAAGWYNICLTTTDSSGCSSTYCCGYSLQKLSSAEGENTMVNVQVIGGVATVIQNPEVFQSWSVFPNPISANTVINYSLSSDAAVNMNIYDVVGNKLSTLVNAKESSGDHQIKMDATKLQNGIYILQIHVGNRIASKKLVVMN